MTKKISEIAMTLPFTISAYGSVAQTTDQNKIWADRVRSVVGTLVGERVMRPKFGSNIPQNIFENESDKQSTLAAKLEDEIDGVFAKFLPLLTLNSVQVSFDDFENVVTAEIIYSLPNEELVTTNLGISTISSTSPITQETL